MSTDYAEPITASSARLASAEAPLTVEAALERAVAQLKSQQDEAGWWKGELETNVTMDAEDLLLREFLGIRTERETIEAARWIRSKQRADGSWANFYGGPGDLSTTCEAWVALRLAGDAPDAEHMRRAAVFAIERGGIERCRVFTRIWFALFGLWSWDELPIMPPELVLLPAWAPLNIYNWGCWARQTIVPLTLVTAARPVRDVAFDISPLRSGAVAVPDAPVVSWAGAFQKLDRVLHRYSQRPIKRVRAIATTKALEWILARQEADGSWGGIQPPWVYSLLALHLHGYPLDHPVMRAGLAGLESFIVCENTPDGIQRRVEACQSPVWDTGLAVTALLDAGVAASDKAVARAADWLVAEEITVTGDWAVRRPELPAGGWAFEFCNDGYPDTDDAAEVILALHRTAARTDPALERGIDWVIGMQSADGGWGAFDADNTHTLALKLPFCDFGAVIDPPSADVTAHIVEMLAAVGRTEESSCQRGIKWLLDAQEPDGSWFGRWGANYVYGTGAVVPALVAAGVDPARTPIRRAVTWLEQHQNRDGGWGEDLRSYIDPAWAGVGASTASQTAWALLALLAAGEHDSEAVRRGVNWLVATQLPSGTWDEPYFTGTGFPGDFYINYHLYRLVFPISALGRYLAAVA
jgi:squalene-hopene/tetraprenyl-beta-curcumene cyclase